MHEGNNFLLKTHKVEQTEQTIKIYLNILTLPKSFITFNTDFKIISHSPYNLIIPPVSLFDDFGYKDELQENIIKFLNEIELRNTKKMYKISGIELPPVININGNIEYACERKGIGFLTLKKPYMEIQCNYCMKTDAIYKSQPCRKCNNDLTFEFKPKYEKTLGYLNHNFKVIKFLKQTFQFNCSCGDLYETQLDESPFKSKCFSCFNPIFIKILFIRVKSEKEMYRLVLGSSLPDKGTCKHYKKSFRWFKFPCCGRMFPCDICHNENSNHPNETASKMICGFCSKEQNCKIDCSCGMSLKNSTSFWNGGKGMRDKTKLNKNDSKKYKK